MNDTNVNNGTIKNCDNNSIDERIEKATLLNYNEVSREIAAIESEVVREAYGHRLAKVLKVKPATIMKEIGATEKSDTVELCAVFPELIDLVEDKASRVGYLVKKDGVVGLADSWTKVDGATCYPPGKEHLQYRLGNSKRVQEHYDRDEDLSVLYDDLVTYFKRFSYLPDDTWPIIVFSVFLSYLQDHNDVRYIPTVYFYAVAERGKSRTAKSMLSVSYRGVHLGDMNSANIFRYSQNQNATLFLDCTDLWKTAMKAGGEDILLNRFEKGARVSRVQYPERGAFHDQAHYDIFGSTIIATNEPVNPILESRCLSITMPNRPGEYENGTPEMGLHLKERLIAWRARMMDQRLIDMRPVDGISGRLWDISKPLFQLCELIKPEVKDDMCNVLLGLVDKKSEDKKESIEGQIVAAIKDLAIFMDEVELVIPVEDIRKVVNFGRKEKYQVSPQKLGKRIQSLSLRTKKMQGYAYLCIGKRELDLLAEQYGLHNLDTEDDAVESGPVGVEVEKSASQVESGREWRECIEGTP